MNELTREAVVSLIKKIYIYEKQEGENYPRIEVCFKYAEEFQVSLDLIESMQHQDSIEKEGDEAHGEDE